MQEFNTSYIGLRKELLQFIQGPSAHILDVGCATGMNGKYLLEKKIASVVYGIELDELMAKEAKNYYSKVFIGNLNDCNFIDTIIKENFNFDYILLGDILEHLMDPVNVLNQLKKKLRQNGKIIISLPNVAHIETFIQIFIHGTFPQNARGIFDKTHLRWYTKKDAISLVRSCELEVIYYIPKLRARDAIGSEFDWKYNFIKMINKEWVTFQHLLICGHAK